MNKKINDIYVYDGPELITEFSQGYLLTSYNDKDKILSLLKIIENNSEYYRSKIQKIIASFIQHVVNIDTRILDKEIFRLLIYSNDLVEQSTIKSRAWVDGIILLALNHELEKIEKYNLIYKGSNKSVHKSLKILCAKKKYKYVWLKQKKTKYLYPSKNPFFNNKYLLVKGFIFLINYFFKRFNFRNISIPKWNISEKSIFVFSYFFNLDIQKAENGLFFSNQWGDLPNYLKNYGYKNNWLHIFLKSPQIQCSKKAITLLKRFRNNSDNDNHVILDQFLTLKIFSTTLGKWLLSVQFYYLYKKQFSNFWKDNNSEWLWPIFESDWKNSWVGHVAMQNLIWIFLFDKALSQLPYQRKGLYLQENQNWERIFIYKWKKSGHGQIVGVPHSTISFWDLRYFDSITKKYISRLPQPDLIAVNGKHAWKMFKNSGLKVNKLRKVEALRYQYLKDQVIPLPNTHKKSSKKCLLVLCDILQEKTHDMLFDIEKSASNLLNQYDIIIKPHPANTINLNLYPSLIATLSYQSLKHLFSVADIIVASVFTSAGLDAYCAGFPLVNYINSSDLNFSTLKSFKSVKFVSSNEELFESLMMENITVLSSPKIDEIFWLNENLIAWNSLLKIN